MESRCVTVQKLTVLLHSRFRGDRVSFSLGSIMLVIGLLHIAYVMLIYMFIFWFPQGFYHDIFNFIGNCLWIWWGVAVSCVSECVSGWLIMWLIRLICICQTHPWNETNLIMLSHFFFNYLLNLTVCLWVGVSGGGVALSSAWGDQKRVLKPLELALQAFGCEWLIMGDGKWTWILWKSSKALLVTELFLQLHVCCF